MVAPPPFFALRMALFYAGYLAVNGVMLPFFPVWLVNRGLSASEIAVCLSLPLFLRVLATPFGSYFADHAPNRRFAIRIFTFVAAFVFAFVGWAPSFWPILILSTISVTFWNLALPAAEALTLTGVRRFGLDYGKMRLYGSVSFIVFNIGSGLLLSWIFPEGAIFWMLVGTFIISALVSITLPVTPKEIRALDDAERPPAPSTRKVLGHPVFVAIIVAAGLVQASHAEIYSFGSIYWQSRGFSPTEIGALWATGVIAEIILFRFSGRVGQWFNPLTMIGIGAAAAVLRWSLFSLEPGLVGAFLLQLLHAFSFGATFIGVQRAITERVPEEITGAAQGFNVVVGGLMMASGIFVSGPLYRTYGVDAFLLMAVPAAIGLVIVLLWWPRRRQSL